MPSIADGVDRVPAVEIMLNDATVRKMLEEERDSEIAEIIKSSPHEGMQDFTSSLMELIEKELVDQRVAYTYAPNVEELKMKIKGISTTGAGGMRT